MKIQFTAVLLLLGGSAFASLTVQPSATLFENEQVKVARALEKGPGSSKLHKHDQDRVMVYLEPGTQRFEYQSGKPAQVFHWKAGQVEWSTKGEMHSWQMTETNSFNIIEVMLKAAGSGQPITSKLDPLKLDPKHYKLEFENEQVRVLRVNIEGHGVTPMHEHSLNRVTVYLTDQNFRTKDPEGKVNMVKRAGGEAVWATPLTHTEENLSEEPFEAIAIELKK